jgi:hypothetical protein
MTYKVVNFNPKGSDAAAQLESIISINTASQWTYVETTMISTYIPGSDGCFGVGAKPGYNQTQHIVVFKKD